MKYIGQINGVLAAVGLLVAIYALFQTIFAPRDSRYLDLEALRASYRAEPLRGEETPALPAAGETAGTTARSGLVMPMGTPGPGAVSGLAQAGSEAPPASGVVGGGVRRPIPAPRPGAARRPITGTEVRAGAPAGSGEDSESDWRNNIRVRPGFPPPEAAEQVQEEAVPARQPQPRFRPPAGAEGLKRDTSPEGPPVRGSAVPQPRN
ncbi:MAG: hypothetical protein Kow00109_10600 [Acidobacteriota bacterium]